MTNLNARPTGDQEVAGSTTARSATFFSRRLIMKLSTAILSLPLIQEGQLSVFSERICTILEDLACPVKVWSSKLTALDITPLSRLGRKISIQTNKKQRYVQLTFYYILHDMHCIMYLLHYVLYKLYDVMYQLHYVLYKLHLVMIISLYDGSGLCLNDVLFVKLSPVGWGLTLCLWLGAMVSLLFFIYSSTQ